MKNIFVSFNVDMCRTILTALLYAVLQLYDIVTMLSPFIIEAFKRRLARDHFLVLNLSTKSDQDVLDICEGYL